MRTRDIAPIVRHAPTSTPTCPTAAGVLVAHSLSEYLHLRHLNLPDAPLLVLGLSPLVAPPAHHLLPLWPQPWLIDSLIGSLRRPHSAVAQPQPQRRRTLVVLGWGSVGKDADDLHAMLACPGGSQAKRQDTKGKWQKARPGSLALPFGWSMGVLRSPLHCGSCGPAFAASRLHA